MSALAAISRPVVASVIVVALTVGAAGGVWAGRQEASIPTAVPVVQPGAVLATDAQDLLLETLYQHISPSVVNIKVTQTASATANALPNLPNIPGFQNPFGQDPFGQGQGQGSQNPVQQAEGSGWVYDAQGDIVTNNHVVSGADRITVTFYDDRSVTAKLVAADPDSDLAVIKVDPTGLDLRPLTLGDSRSLKVGQQVIAIGDPFGLEGTMTTGIVSALGRSLPAGEANTAGANYTIPDIIQTDAAINPGNSGGALLNTNGELIGVTAAIESPVRANSGVGFAIPSRIVAMVIPALLQTGKVEHPSLGIAGATLSPQLNQAMGLPADQRGVLVIDVTRGSPAARANLQASSRTVTLDGAQAKVGGDVIVGVDGQAIHKFDDLLTYLQYNTKVGQKVALKVLRGGKTVDVKLTLAARPAVQNRLASVSDTTPLQ
jgi:serine protease Do